MEHKIKIQNNFSNKKLKKINIKMISTIIMKTKLIIKNKINNTKEVKINKKAAKM